MLPALRIIASPCLPNIGAATDAVGRYVNARERHVLTRGRDTVLVDIVRAWDATMKVRMSANRIRQPGSAMR